ncbi:MAG: hypothetical protein IJT58_06485 [Synergistaceae bacterium]|nr:hypothetical protein [Synergistaceae bacterium]
MSITSNVFMTLTPVLFPIVAGFALFSQPIFEDRHIYVGVMTFAASIITFFSAFMTSEELITLWRITDTLSIAFRFDYPARAFACLVAFIWPLVSLYAFEYLRRRPPVDRFYAFFLSTFGILIGVACAGNLLTLYLFYELMTFMTLPLVMHSQQREAIRATVSYLLYSLVGAALALGGFFFFQVYGVSMDFTPGGVLDIARIKAANNESMILIVTFLTLVGFGAKAGMVPLHAWLPTAHPVAPTPASAVLSGLITKAGIIAMFRVIYYVAGPDFLRGTWVQKAVICMALITIFTGSMMAYIEKHLKKRIAWSTVSQVSYVVFAMMLLNPDGIRGAVLQIAAHAMSKSCLFLSAGVVIYFTLQGANYHYADQLKGVGKELPVTMTCFSLASVSLIGLPITGGFAAKFYMASGALAPNTNYNLGMLGVIILMISALLTAGYLLPIVTDAFFPGEDYDYTGVVPFHMPWIMRVPLILLSVGAVLTGLFAGEILDFVNSKIIAVLL